MKFATVASLCLASTAAPRLVRGGGFDNLMSLVAQLEEEAALLTAEYGSKDAEIAALLDQLTECKQSGGDGGGTSDDTTSTPTPSTPSTTPSPTSGAPEEELESTTPSPTAPPAGEDTGDSAPISAVDSSSTPTEFSTSTPVPEEEDGGEGGGNYVFSVGRSWNYNLATPVETDADVDVFFIDMGEFLRNDCYYEIAL